jgi:predicted nucleotidyltransferase
VQRTLEEFVERCRVADAENIRSIILYGSAASEEFSDKHSDLNILILVERDGLRELEQLAPVARWWAKLGHPTPLVFTPEQLRDSADVFAIELLDMKARHRTLYGEHFIESVEVPMDLHRLHVERELRVNSLRLREAILTIKQNDASMLNLMLDSVSSFVALFRHAMIALGEQPPTTHAAVIERIAAIAGSGDAANAFSTILALRRKHKSAHDIDVRQTLAAYLTTVEQVASEVDRRLASR